MTEGKEEPRIGPFQVQVPPPSTNGSHVERTSTLQVGRRILGPLTVALIVSLTTVPRASLLRADQLAHWWRPLIAVIVAGVASGIAQRHSARDASLTGAAVSIAGLFVAFSVVRGQAASTGPIASELAVLAAWGVVAGGFSAVAARSVYARMVHR